jgi:hypothetical protein
MTKQRYSLCAGALLVTGVVAVFLTQGCATVKNALVGIRDPYQAEAAILSMNQYEYGYAFENDRYSIVGDCKIDRTLQTIILSVVDQKRTRRSMISYTNNVVSIDDQVIGKAESLQDAFRLLTGACQEERHWMLGALMFPRAVLDLPDRVLLEEQYLSNDIQWGKYDLPLGAQTFNGTFGGSFHTLFGYRDLTSGGFVKWLSFKSLYNGKVLSKLWIHDVRLKK